MRYDGASLMGGVTLSKTADGARAKRYSGVAVEPDGNGVALVSNALEPPPDEGIRRSAQELAAVLAAKGARIYSITQGAPFATRKLLLSPRLVRTLQKDRVVAVIYVPTQSATLGSLVRSAVLRSLVGVRVVMLALQPRDFGAIARTLARYVGPDIVLTPSPSLLREAERSGVQAGFLQLGADVDRFQPVSSRRKLELRRKYDLPAGEPIVLHVGHARRLRNLDWITDLGSDVVRVVVIGRSLGLENEVLETLREAHVRVVDEYVPDVHELYQLADVYAFPVRDQQSAIAAPLSVLEAMASNLPVVTTRFGALPHMVSPGGGLFFADDQQQFSADVQAALTLPREEIRTREQVVRYSWSSTCEIVLGSALDQCRRK